MESAQNRGYFAPQDWLTTPGLRVASNRPTGGTHGWLKSAAGRATGSGFRTRKSFIRLDFIEQKSERSVMPQDTGVGRNVGLDGLDFASLRRVWEQTFGATPPSSLSRVFLCRVLAYERQCRTHGGLSAATRRALAAMVNGTPSSGNPELAERRRHKRRALLEATCKELEKVCRMVERRRLQGKENIRAAVKKLLNKYKVGSYYRLDIRDDGFDFELDETTMDADASRLASGNSELANKRLQRWKRHVETIAKQLDQIRQRIGRGQLHGKDKIGVRVGKVLNKYKVGKHFTLDIRDNSFSFEIDDTKVTAEAALDGFYVIRTSLAEQRMKTDDLVRSYKLLTQVERAFRSFKNIDLKVRPIRHRRENRVRAHIFLCMLSYYVLWHMMEAWRPLLFADEDQQAKAKRDPVAPAKRSEAAMRKIQTKKLDDGSPASSFRTLLRLLSNIVRNKCRTPGAASSDMTFDVTTSPALPQGPFLPAPISSASGMAGPTRSRSSTTAIGSMAKPIRPSPPSQSESPAPTGQDHAFSVSRPSARPNMKKILNRYLIAGP